MNTDGADDERVLSEDELAEQLERIHDALIDSRRSQDTDTSTEARRANVADEQLVMAKRILNLIEHAKEFGIDNDDETAVDGKTVASELIASEANTSGEGLECQLTRFKIIKLLGQGGYGTVYLARDPNLDRHVALKFPRPEVLTTPDLKQRFIHEARSASTLSHPNIVAVYEAGKDGGVYFIAYEYVRGQTLDQWFKQRNEPVAPDQAAEIIAVLADAISHAHDRGIIHRDLKPSNVLLELQSDEDTAVGTANNDSAAGSQPGHIRTSFADRLRIADFGLSKSIHNDARQTHTGALVGTPAYMSPEQTGDGRQEVQPATDVFSLGVMLYELLTGRVPFGGSTVMETVRNVQEKEPSPPRRLNGSVPRDLEAICLKCLEKDPARRYATAFALQRDLRNYLGRFPVQARPITRLDRLGRWARRNPTVASLGGLAAAFLFVALAASVIGWSSTRTALRRESTAKSAAEQRYLEIKNAIDTYFNKVCEDPRIKRLPQTEPLRQELLQLALDYYENFAQEAQDDPDLSTEVAKTHIQIGEIMDDLRRPRDAVGRFEEALQLLDHQLTIQPNLPDLMALKAKALDGAAKARFNLGDSDTALELNSQSIAIQRGLVAARPSDWESRRRLAEYEIRRGFVSYGSHDYESALASFEQATSLFASVMEHKPHDAELELRSLVSKRMVSSSLHALGRMREAEGVIADVISELSNLIEREPTLWEASFSFVVASLTKADYRLMQHDFKGAEQVLLEALAVVETLCQVQPELTRYLHVKNGTIEKLAIVFDEQGGSEVAQFYFEEGLETAEKMFQLDSGSADATRGMGHAALNLGSFLHRNEIDLARAEELFLKAHELFSNLAEDPRQVVDSELSLAFCAIGLSGIAHDHDSDSDKALRHVNDAVEICQRLRKEQPDNPRINQLTCVAYGERGGLLDDLGRHHEAIADRRRCLELALEPMKPLCQAELALSLIKNNETDEALQLIHGLESTIQLDVDKAPPPDSQLSYRLSQCFTSLATKKSQTAGDTMQNRIDAAMGYLRRSVDQGYFSSAARVAALRTDMHFEALHELPAFQQLVSELTANVR